jgi:hypothetical protein
MLSKLYAPETVHAGIYVKPKGKLGVDQCRLQSDEQATYRRSILDQASYDTVMNRKLCQWIQLLLF